MSKKKKPKDSFVIFGIGSGGKYSTVIDKNRKENAKADQQRWGKEHRDKTEARKVKATKGGRGKRQCRLD